MMQKKTKAQLIEELQKLRAKNLELEKITVDENNIEKTKYNELINSIVFNSEDVIIVQDVEGKYLFYNGSTQFGLDAETVVGKKPHDFFDPDTADRYMENIKKVFISGEKISSQGYVKWLGKMLWFSGQHTPIKDSSGKVKSVITISRDITDLKKAEIELKNSEDKLRSSEDKYRTIFETTGQALAIIEENTTISLVNGEFEKLAGYSKKEIEGKKSWTEFVLEEDLNKMMEYHTLRRIAPDSAPNSYEFQYLDANGNEKGMYLNVSMIPNTKKSVAFLLDVTEQKRAEKIIQESEERFQSLLRSVDDIVWSATHDGSEYLYLNPSVERVYGRSLDEFYNNPNLWHEVVHPDDAARVRASDQELFHKGSSEIVYRIIRPDGEIRWLHARKNIVYDDEGKPIRMGGIGTDITERIKVEEELKLFRSLIDQSNDTVEIIDPKTGRFIDVNEKGCIDHGYSREEFLSLNVLDIDPLLEPSTFTESNNEFFPSSNMLRQSIHRRKDGSTFPVEVNMKYVHFEKDYVISIVRDITERKQAENALIESEYKLNEAQRLAHLGNWDWDIEKNKAQCSDETYRIFGITRQDYEWSLETFLNSVHPDDREFVMNATHETLTSGSPFSRDFRIVLPDGLERTVHGESKLVYDENNKPIRMVGTVQDITERKRAEEERIRLIIAIEHSNDNISIADKDGAFIFINPAFEKTTGYQKQEVIGHTPDIFFSSDEGKKNARELKKKLMKNEVFNGQLYITCKDGTKRMHELTISPVLDKTGDVTGSVAVGRDITEKMRMEKRLREAQKMEAIGTLAGGIAHDFNNILLGVIGYTELAMVNIEKDTQLHSDLNSVLKAAYRAKDLVNQILTFSRRHKKEKQPIQIGPIVREVLKLLRASVPTTVEFSQKIEADMKCILGDPIQIHQVIINLCTNATQSMSPNGGILEVSLASIEIDDDSALQYPDISPGSYQKLTVSDTGQGIKPELLNRIFEPYFTTKNKGEGTGLGLAVVHGIVQSHGGTITVYSEYGEGTTFNVYFPVIEDGPVEEIEDPDSIPAGNERILFVDDEPMISNMGERLLGSLGYEVVTRTNSIEALELFRNDPDTFDLVIVDMTMPYMTGDEMAEKLLRIRPDIPIILNTGFSEMITEEKAKSKGIRAFMMKPFDKNKLAETIRQVLDQK